MAIYSFRNTARGQVVCEFVRHVPKLLSNVRIIRPVTTYDPEHPDRVRVSRIIPLAS